MLYLAQSTCHDTHHHDTLHDIDEIAYDFLRVVVRSQKTHELDKMLMEGFEIISSLLAAESESAGRKKELQQLASLMLEKMQVLSIEIRNRRK